MNTIRIETLGCRLNQIESEASARFFIDAGFSVYMENITSQSSEDSQTILCILNTCTVTQKAEQKARRIIRLLLKKYENAVLLVTGCYAQLAASEIGKIDERIVVLGGQIKSRIQKLPELILKYQKENEWDVKAVKELIQNEIVAPPVFKPHFPENSFSLSTTSFLSHSRASLKIQDGCNNNCSYCAIHQARGHSVSIDVETAINRVKELEAAGQKEVVLTTVNIGQYKGKYKNSYCNISQLLKLLLENTSKIRLRISSLYPEVVDDEFCKVVSDSRICPHFHISVQSGSDKILKSMNRVYSSQDVIDACEKLRTVKENPFIACDLITGFPGETDEDFEQTKKLCQKCNFTWIHAFPYSERPNTLAAQMKNKVPQSISGERARWLTEFAAKNKIEYINNCVGKDFQAVLETITQKDKKTLTCVTNNFIHCIVQKDADKDSSNTATRNISNNTETDTIVTITSVLKEKILKGGEIEATAILKE